MKFCIQQAMIYNNINQNNIEDQYYLYNQYYIVILCAYYSVALVETLQDIPTVKYIKNLINDLIK